MFELLVKMIPLFNKTDRNSCIDVTIQNRAYAYDNKWTLGTCSSARLYSQWEEYTEYCCLPPGRHRLTCIDLGEGGWHGGSIQVDGKTYCRDFINGHQQVHDIDILGKVTFSNFEKIPPFIASMPIKNMK